MTEFSIVIFLMFAIATQKIFSKFEITHHAWLTITKLLLHGQFYNNVINKQGYLLQKSNKLK